MKRSPKVSITIPLFNVAGEVRGLFNSISKQQEINKGEIEVVIVDDASTDNTVYEINKHKYLLKKYNSVKIIKSQKNLGRVAARITAAKNSKGSHLIFLDAKTRPNTDYMVNLISKHRDIVIGHVYMDKKRSIWDKIMFLIRKKIYPNHFDKGFKDLLLDKESYKRFEAKGGGGAMFVKKTYFLKACKKISQSRYTNDDSKLVEQMALYEKVLITSHAKIKYLNRTKFWPNIRHLFERGPRFVDYYLKPSSRYFPLLILFIVLLAINLLVLFTFPCILILELFSFLIVLLFTSIWLSEEPTDFIPLFSLLPVLVLSFGFGIIKGFYLKIIGKI